MNSKGRKMGKDETEQKQLSVKNNYNNNYSLKCAPRQLPFRISIEDYVF